MNQKLESPLPRYVWYSLLFVCISFFNFSCTPLNKVSNQNLSFLYKESSSSAIEYRLYRFSEDSCLLYVKLNPSRYLAMKQSDGTFMSKVSVRIQFMPAYESDDFSTLPDSLLFMMPTSASGDTIHFYYDQFRFKRPTYDNYVIRFIVNDQNKKQLYFQYKHIENDKLIQSAVSFLPVNPLNQSIYFNNYLAYNSDFSIKHYKMDSFPLFANYYNRAFPLAEPPFSMKKSVPFNFKPDSVFVFDAGKTNRLSNNGFYHFRFDTLIRDGFTLFRFENQFPKITIADELIEPLRYLTSKSEYESLMSASDKKKAVDAFWLKIAGDTERARQVIRKYYSRVQDANLFFTSYLQGWKSDRGMIFIVFGVPNAVYKTSNTETWIYGDPANMQSIVFTFVKVINPFTDNDFQLNRSLIYQTAWYLAVEAWREGRIFNDN